MPNFVLPNKTQLFSGFSKISSNSISPFFILLISIFCLILLNITLPSSFFDFITGPFLPTIKVLLSSISIPSFPVFNNLVNSVTLS